VSEYDLFVPLYYNDGSEVEPAKLLRLEERLLDEFTGLTVFPQPNRGYWRMAGVTYRDEIIVYRIVTSNRRAARRYLRQLKEELKRDLRQEEILIIERDVKTL
jgi:hypothetical protein